MATETLITCNGQGDNGDHCCVIDGEVCEFLFPWINRCSLFEEWGRLAENPEWVAAPVGQFFARLYPGFDCGDWPQNIPAAMAIGGPSVCCWRDS